MKPILFDRIRTNHTSFEVDLVIDNNVTFIIGDSGTGQSAVYSFLQEMAAENKSIVCFNYLDLKKRYKTTIKQSKEKLFIIDNADILLDDAIRWHIATDGKNQYILIGRNPTGLMLRQDDIMELDSTTADGKTRFYLKHAF
jgi:ABC-type phosphate/phosphonate transport system ATPase subunit